MKLDRKIQRELEECYRKTEWYINKLASYLASMCETPVEDLKQEGFLGMARARELYNPKIASFLTYSQYWIKTYMFSMAYKNAYSVQVPEEFHYIYSKYYRRSREPDMLENPDKIKLIAIELEVSESRLAKIVSIISGLKHGCDLEHADFYVSDNAECIDSACDNSPKLIEILKESVTPEEYFVLNHMVGIEVPNIKTLNWVGKILGVTKERVRQIKNCGLKKFKAALLERGITDGG